MQSVRIVRLATACGVAAALTFGVVLVADHSWNNYHWARTTTSFNLKIVNSTTSDWDPYVSQAIGDWSTNSNVLDMVEDRSGSTEDRDRRQCRGPAGAVRICNLAYGFNGWLGIAGISIDTQGHIVTGYTKLNDSYFSTSTYNRPDWKQSVACQELGHNIGLDHQDEDFDNDVAGILHGLPGPAMGDPQRPRLRSSSKQFTVIWIRTTGTRAAARVAAEPATRLRGRAATSRMPRRTRRVMPGESRWAGRARRRSSSGSIQTERATSPS